MVRRSVIHLFWTAAICLGAGAPAFAQVPPLDISARTSESTLVVVATVAGVSSRQATNAFGDQLLYSDLRLEVSETLKGSPESVLTVTMVGGDAAGTGMRASNHAAVHDGDRAIYFLHPGGSGTWVPCPHGQGILKLDAAERVDQTTLSLDQARVLMQDAAASAVTYTYRVIRQYPHDTSAFTQGLEVAGNLVYEGTGLHGASSVRHVNLQTGAVVRRIDVPAQYFGEGITVFGGKLYQLTWQQGVGFIYNPSTLAKIGEFFYAGEGWGLTHDAENLIMSDGTSQIRFLDPVSQQTVRTIHVVDPRGQPVTQINELEYVNGQIYANIWQTNTIARIDPDSGRVTGWFDMTGLLPAGTAADVLNGIAMDPVSGRLFVTGKLWPWVYEVVLEPIAVN